MLNNYVKYPRTFHLPWSESITDDDRIHPDVSFFEGKEVIVTEKMDGENTTMYSDHIHARSIDSRYHVSRDWVKNFWATKKSEIPTNWRVCGENLYAKHSVAYSKLESFFYGFSIWNELNECLPWDETVEWMSLLGITTVPVLYRGKYNESLIKGLFTPTLWESTEGYVLRTVDGFPFKDFRQHVGKFVRNGHVQTSKHWMFDQQVEENKLKDS